MTKSTTHDMTQGPIIRMLVKFMIPVALGLLFQQLYNMVDAIVIGHFLGLEAVAGVGSTGPFSFFVLGFCNGTCGGFAIPIAQKFGKKDYSSMRRYVVNAVYLAAILSVCVTTVVCVFCKPLLLAMNTDPAFFREAYDYIIIIFLGIPAIMMYNTFFGIIRALGDSKTPLYFLLASSAINIVLDLVTVCWFHMGVAGPALATVISQLFSVLGGYVYMNIRFDILKPTPEERKLTRHHIARLLGIGVPMGLQFSVTAIGSIILQRVVNGFGTVYVAAIATAEKVASLAHSTMGATSQASSTFAGQNYGALRFDRIHKGVGACILLGGMIALANTVVAFLLDDQLIRLFLKLDDSAQGLQAELYSRQAIHIFAICYLSLSVLNSLRGTIQALGYTKVAIFSGIFELFARCAAALLLVRWLGFIALAGATPLAWICADVFLVPCYFACMRRLEKRYTGETLPAPAEAH